MSTFYAPMLAATNLGSVEIPFLPTSLWGIATGLSLVIVLVTCAMYFWYRQRIAAAIGDESDVATLAAKKQQLEAEVLQAQSWLSQNKDELLRLEAERQESYCQMLCFGI